MKLKLTISATHYSGTYDIPLDKQIYLYVGNLSQNDPHFKGVKISAILARGEKLNPFMTVAEAKLQENDELILFGEKRKSYEESKKQIEKLMGNEILKEVLSLMEKIRALIVDRDLRAELISSVMRATYMFYDDKFETIKSLINDNSCLINGQRTEGVKYKKLKNGEYVGYLDEGRKQNKQGFVIGVA